MRKNFSYLISHCCRSRTKNSLSEDWAKSRGLNELVSDKVSVIGRKREIEKIQKYEHVQIKPRACYLLVVGYWPLNKTTI